MKIRVGVIFGGETVEHEVSIISAVQAMEYLDQEKYEIVPIYISKDRIWYTGAVLKEMDVYKDFNNLKKYAKKVILYKKDCSYFLQSVTGFKRNIAEIDIVLPIVHGNNAEDGTIQGYLETIGIPYVGSRILGSAIGQDKVVMKQIFKSEGIPIVDYTWFFDNEYYANKNDILENIKNLGYPVIVKPATLGSSVGINVVKDETSIEEAIINAIKYDNKIIVEKLVSNLTEINCSVIGNYEFQETSVLEEVISADKFLTYDEKYIGKGKGKFKGGVFNTKSSSKGNSNRILPAKIDEKLEQEVKDIACRVFKVLNLSGICRIDFLIDKNSNKVYINEPNTIPGSLSFYLWEPTGKKYTQLLDDIITIAIKDYKNRSKKIYSFETNILTNYDGFKGFKSKLK